MGASQPVEKGHLLVAFFLVLREKMRYNGVG